DGRGASVHPRSPGGSKPRRGLSAPCCPCRRYGQGRSSLRVRRGGGGASSLGWVSIRGVSWDWDPSGGKGDGLESFLLGEALAAGGVDLLLGAELLEGVQGRLHDVGRVVRAHRFGEKIFDPGRLDDRADASPGDQSRPRRRGEEEDASSA